MIAYLRFLPQTASQQGGCSFTERGSERRVSSLKTLTGGKEQRARKVETYGRGGEPERELESVAEEERKD